MLEREVTELQVRDARTRAVRTSATDNAFSGVDDTVVSVDTRAF